jgi:hypothetical protein
MNFYLFMGGTGQCVLEWKSGACDSQSEEKEKNDVFARLPAEKLGRLVTSVCAQFCDREDEPEASGVAGPIQMGMNGMEICIAHSGLVTAALVWKVGLGGPAADEQELVFFTYAALVKFQEQFGAALPALAKSEEKKLQLLMHRDTIHTQAHVDHQDPPSEGQEAESGDAALLLSCEPFRTKVLAALWEKVRSKALFRGLGAEVTVVVKSSSVDEILRVTRDEGESGIQGSSFDEQSSNFLLQCALEMYAGKCDGRVFVQLSSRDADLQQDEKETCETLAVCKLSESSQVLVVVRFCADRVPVKDTTAVVFRGKWACRQIDVLSLDVAKMDALVKQAVLEVYEDG